MLLDQGHAISICCHGEASVYHCDVCRYTDIFIGTPKVEEDYIQADITPQQCRLRDMTYSAPISVDIEYTRGKEVIVKKGKNGVGAVIIGRLPLMLRSGRCVPKPCHTFMSMGKAC